MTENRGIVGTDHLLEFEYFPEEDRCVVRALHSGYEYCVVRRLSMAPEVMVTPGTSVVLGVFDRLLQFVEQCNVKRKDFDPAAPAVPISKVEAFRLIYKGWVKFEPFTDQENARVQSVLPVDWQALQFLAEVLGVRPEIEHMLTRGFDQQKVRNVLLDSMKNLTEEEQTQVRSLVGADQVHAP